MMCFARMDIPFKLGPGNWASCLQPIDKSGSVGRSP